MADHVKRSPPRFLPPLSQFYGSARFFQHSSGLTYTEGVKAVADGAGYWLLDLIGGHQRDREVKKAGWLQVWTLTRLDAGGSELLCADPNYLIVLRQRIYRSDFPARRIELWVENGRIILPTEH